jgi:hypothetical protein
MCNLYNKFIHLSSPDRDLPLLSEARPGYGTKGWVMKSEMYEGVSSLAPANYEPYLKIVQEVVEHTSSLFTFSSRTLQIQRADTAFQVSQEFKKREGTRNLALSLHMRNQDGHSPSGRRTGAITEQLGKQIEASCDLLRKKYSEAYTASALPQKMLEASILFKRHSVPQVGRALLLFCF